MQPLKNITVVILEHAIAAPFATLTGLMKEVGLAQPLIENMRDSINHLGQAGVMVDRVLTARKVR